ncbi:MAG: SH3 domain-containing protein [Hylemonella sp.]|nr:SH3 domain-containing protein [Hylemonella sp.]
MKNLIILVLLLFLKVHAGEVQYVLGTVVNLREEPRASARIVAKLPIATEVEVLESEGSWRRVVTKAGDQPDQKGWLASEFLTSQRPTIESILKSAESDERKARSMWAGRAAALDRLAAEALRQQMPHQDGRKFLNPFVDLNSVKPRGIYKTESGIVFRTAAGIKIFHSETSSWSYGVATPESVFSVETYKGLLWESFGLWGIEFPKWYPVGSYTSIEDVSGVGNSSWMLVTQPNEGGGYDGQDVVDTKLGKIYQLPYDRFTSLLVDGSTAWLGSVDGVTAIDLQSLARTDYLTLPVGKGVIDAYALGNKVYYGVVDAGAFIVHGDDGSVKPIQAVNQAVQQGYRMEDMVLHEEKFFFLMSSVDKSGYLRRQKALLGVHDPKTGVTRMIDTGLQFADKLRTDDGRVYGYGHKAEWYEGGQRGDVTGGVFEYRTANGKLAKLSDQPLDYWIVKDSVGLFVEDDEGEVSDIQHRMGGTYVPYRPLLVSRYAREQDRLVSLNAEAEMIFEVKGDFYDRVPDGRTEGLNSVPLFDFQAFKSTDRRLETIELIREMRNFERLRAQERSKRIDSNLSALLVRPETIVIRRGKVKMAPKREIEPQVQPL